MNPNRSILLIGFIPELVDFTDFPGMTAERLHNFLEKPHGKMPDSKLGDTDIDNVAAYILSLKH